MTHDDFDDRPGADDDEHGGRAGSDPAMSLTLRIPAQGVELVLEPADPPLQIGRDPQSGVLFPNRLVSARHARVLFDGSNWIVEDLGSTNGTFVQGVQRSAFPVAAHTVVQFGDPATGEVVEFEPGRPIETTTPARQPTVAIPAAAPGGEWWSAGAPAMAPRAVDRAGAAVFAVHELTVETNGVRRLDRLSFELPAGAMLGVLGGSGAGKSTLVKAITGSDPATAGTVAFEGYDLYRDFKHVRRRIGYVPQDDILHMALTVRATLEYGTILRMPEASPTERRARASEVLEELGIGHRVDAKVSELSGGQRKRLNVALELLSRPPLLILDEPTSGLDPANERSLMELLRLLADGGRTVIVVTHSTESLHLCDDVLLLARGGVPVYLGPAGGLAPAFGQSNLIDAFGFVDNHHNPADLRAAFDHTHPVVGRPAVVAFPAPPAPTDWKVRWTDSAERTGRDMWTMTRRSIDILRGDRRNAMILAAQAPVIGVLLALLFNGGNLDLGKLDHNGEGANLLMAMVLGVIFMGAAGTVREIVKERPLMLREQAVGVSTPAYLGSKMLVQGAVVVVQALVVVAVAGLANAGPTDGLVGLGPANEILLAVSLGGLVAAATGLLISAFVTTTDKAMTLLPVYLFVQLLLAGMIVPVHSGAMRPLSWLITSKWGVDGVGSVGSMWDLRPDCLAKSDQNVCSANWYHEAGNFVLAIVMLTVMLLLAMYGTYRALSRNDPASVLSTWEVGS